MKSMNKEFFMFFIFFMSSCWNSSAAAVGNYMLNRCPR
jgi:hypothetical protein